MTISGIGDIFPKCPICQNDLLHDSIDDIETVQRIVKFYSCMNHHVFSEEWKPMGWRQEND